MKRLVASFITYIFVGLTLSACATTNGTPLEITSSTQTIDGVVVTLEKASAKYVSNPGAYDYSFDVRIENNSDENIMQVAYMLRTIGADGQEIRSFTHFYDKETSALAPGETVKDHIDSRWGPAEPASVEIELRSIKTEAELPAIKLPQKGEFLYQALGNERLANIKQDPPVELSFHIDQGGYGRTATFTQGETLDTALDLFCNIRIGNEASEWVTDNYNWIWLSWDDDTACGISLNLRNLEFSGHASNSHVYDLENLDAFWDYAAARAVEDSVDPIQDS